jgi:uncharacterized OB-fold protein
VCPFCLSKEVSWQDSDGTGTVRSHTTYHRAFHPYFEALVPYSVGWVGLPEGVAVPTLFDLTGLDASAIEVGAPVVATFEDLDDEVTAIRFRPLV